MNDTITVSSLRQAYRAALEEARGHLVAGRSAEFAADASESYFAPRAAAALAAHDARRTCEERAGKDFRAEASAAFHGAIKLLRCGKPLNEAWDFFWVRLSTAVIPKELF